MLNLMTSFSLHRSITYSSKNRPLHCLLEAISFSLIASYLLRTKAVYLQDEESEVTLNHSAMLNNFFVEVWESSLFLLLSLLVCFFFLKKKTYSIVKQGKINSPSYKINQFGISEPINLSENYDYVDGHWKTSMTAGWIIILLRGVWCLGFTLSFWYGLINV